MGIFKLQILNWLYNPLSRISFFFVFLSFNIFDSFYNPITLSSIFLRTLLETILFILLIEMVTYIILNSKISKKQERFICSRLAVITLPLSVISLISLFVIFRLPKDNIFLEVSSILLLFLILLKAMKSVRYSLIITGILLAVFFILIDASRNNILISLMASFLTIGILLRYSETDPHVSTHNSELDELLDKHSKFKEKRKETMIEGQAFCLNNKLFFKRDNSFFDSLDTKTENKELQQLDFLRNKIMCLQKERTKNFLKRFIPEGFPDKEWLLKRLYQIIKRFLGKKTTHLTISTLSLLFFNRKAMRRFSKRMIESYDNIPQNKLDSKLLWVSDLELDLINEHERENLFMVEIILKKFIELPADYHIEKLRKAINEYLKNREELEYQKIMEKRLKEGKKIYGEYKRIFKGYKNISEIFKNNFTYVNSIKEIISES